jgi:RNA polymerase sigma factor (sigma-70 family)
VTDWRGAEKIDDRWLAESLRETGAPALPQLYGSYAARLYDYCHTYLHDRGGAAGAVLNSLVAAQEHIGRLREPELLRGWLYAIARRECQRRIDSRYDVTESDDMLPFESAAPAELSEEEQAQLARNQELISNALSVLTADQREAVLLATRHELDTGEVTRVLGLGGAESADLVEEAREAFSAAVSAALVAHDAHDDCPSAHALIDTWPPPPELFPKLIRHVEACPVCGGRRRRRVPTRRLLQMLPSAELPGELWLEFYMTASDPEQEQRRLAIAQLAEPFDEYGWPAGVARVPHEGRRRGGSHVGRQRLAAVGAACAVVVVAVSAAAAFSGVSGQNSNLYRYSGGKPPTVGDASPTDTLLSPADSPPRRRTSATVATSKKPKSTPSTTKTASPSPTATKSHPTSTSPNPPPTTQTPGTLSVSGCDTQGSRDCQITVTAVGGPVSWSVSGTSHSLSASGSGTLAAGASTTVTVHYGGICFLTSGNGAVSFSPNGRAEVTYSC